MQQNGLLGVGGVGLLGCMLGLWPTLLGVLSLLGWAAAEAAELAWEYWKVHSEPGVLYLGKRSRSHEAVMMHKIHSLEDYIASAKCLGKGLISPTKPLCSFCLLNSSKPVEVMKGLPGVVLRMLRCVEHHWDLCR